ncbi:centlein isoform X6 [Myiozetetes cayanensis]|uniref:centlein isoform X6 n=1 Tax=Myiozetetes cayanensis TaxID=478635 RepID=UPI00215FC6EE|nr:centlein isoform X6 [Myiozetetes cayanensis]
MASRGAEAAVRQVAELEQELRGLAEELSCCQADKEFVCSLWKHLQVSSPDLMQAVSLAVEREKQKAEVKDRRVLELLEAKDSKIETLEQRLTGQRQEINNLMQRKNAVEEENACLKNEFTTLNQKFKDKSQELKDTEECAQKKEEQNRLVIKNLEEENKGLNTCCADLLSDLEKLRKQEAQWKMEKSGNDAIIKNLKTDLAEAREQIEELRSICGNLSSQVAVRQEELFQNDCVVIKAKKELQELQNLCGQNTEYTAQQSELIKQLQALNANTQKVVKDQEDAHTAEITLYQKLYNELSLCFETVKTSEIQLQQSCASLQDQLLEKDKKICLLQVQLQEAHNASNGVHQNSSPKYQVQEPPVKRSRSLSPKSSFRESEELRKLKIAERKIENLEKTLRLKTQETDELRAAYEKHKERLQMLQTNYRALKEQLKQWEEGDTRLENSKSRYQHADSCQLSQEDPDVVWNELAFFKREHKKLLIEKLNLEEELDQMKIHQSVEPLRKLSEDDGVKNNTPVKNMREVSHQMLQKNSNNEITKQSTTIKSLKNEVQEKEERIQELQTKISHLERDVTVKRHLIEDLKSHLKASQENEKTSNETLESLEKKVKALAEDCSGKKTSIDSLKQRLNVATKEKSQYEQMYHKAKDELGKKDLKLTKLESKMIETERAMTELETAASDQLHSLAKQSAEALETLQKKLLLTSEKVEEFKTFVKTLSRELQHSIQELRTKIRKAKKMGEMKACKNCLSQESVQLAASILNVSTTDLEEILDVEDEEETAKAKMEFEKDKEWLHRIQKLMEAQFPFSSHLMDVVLEKLNEKKKLLEEYSSLMKHTI